MVRARFSARTTGTTKPMKTAPGVGEPAGTQEAEGVPTEPAGGPHANKPEQVRGFLASRWGAYFYWNHRPGVTLAALANPRLISRHASGVRRMAKLQSRALARVLIATGNDLVRSNRAC